MRWPFIRVESMPGWPSQAEANGLFPFWRGRSHLRLKKEPLAPFFALVFPILIPAVGFAQNQVTISDFKVLDWFKAVKLTWKASAPQGTEAIFEIYRSDKESGLYSLVQEVKLGDKEFIDIITKNYWFEDKKLEPGRGYYYKLALRGTDQTFGPFRGLASGAPPGT